MSEKRVPDSGKGMGILTQWLPEASTGLPLRTRLANFNDYLLRRAKEDGIPVGQITIFEDKWAKGDEAVMEIIRREIQNLVARTQRPPEQLPDPEV
ncbi:hypothetical protein A2973_04185 [Candidatus Gottesmanbacteria bacterium RIFCSPLOWO2_01_FULL_49_10]|uniref:Uncharacterized protein n=1 Tax=Candidatus Gottesmanbacteria bacterium RIFCSPLOWO2_01_FULL_49_10 TaxID=1798396 RepID=A0A1F6AXM3_9BACT|nr:MAG: hypothetical protein A2973_04185 [Candidatus Gottesmanbacteria bacterium RIFCSPLOWO2_01_FULL_49_10]